MDTIQSFFTPEVLWIIAGIVLLIMEFATPGLVIFFFGMGAVVVGVVCLIFEPSFTLQLFIFLASSLIFLFSLRKWLKQVFLGRKSDSESELMDTLDNFLGEKAMVVEKITPAVAGRVELHGTEWKAESDEEIKKGMPVEVIGKKNLVLKVKKLDK
ncbi:NfeD family protein [bacterium]|nr:NfeD family protein [bacterium]